jgi:hypothetical protein
MTEVAAAWPQVAARESFQVVELRRYVTVAGERERFACWFESRFPEAFQQLGAMVLGQFLERRRAERFTWLRGYWNVEARPLVNGAFYFGPLWREHRAATNARLVDSDDVLLLRPLAPERGVVVLPAVDPVDEAAGARGVVVAQIFAPRAGLGVAALAARAEAAFAGYRSAGVREAGVLVTLEGPNNFPQHPVREDGPYLVWLGVMLDEAALAARFEELAAATAAGLAAADLLREAPELIVMDPCRHSRLRWLPSWGGAAAAT